MSLCHSNEPVVCCGFSRRLLFLVLLEENALDQSLYVTKSIQNGTRMSNLNLFQVHFQGMHSIVQNVHHALFSKVIRSN